MKPQTLFAILILIILSACNLPSNLPTPTPTAATPSATQATTTAIPTFTLQPSTSPPATSTSTPNVPVALPREVAVNCRLGPGTGWVVLSGLSLGASSQITGKSSDGSWWQIIDPLSAGRRCWVSSSVTNTAGNVSGVPVVEAPKASVTNVTLDVEPETITTAGCLGPLLPVKLTGSIETDGPTTVQWRFETQQGGAMTTITTEFDSFGEETVSVDFPPTVSAGTYWVRLIVTSPNSIQAEATYTIACP